MADGPTPEETQQICDSLASGRTINAIKIYRSATGKGLKEAKEFIDALGPKLIEQDPEKDKNLSPPQGAGCASVILVSLGIGTAASIMLKAIC